MLTAAQVGMLFITLSLLFFALALRDYVRTSGCRTPARRAWIRIAIIFGAVGLALTLWGAGSAAN